MIQTGGKFTTDSLQVGDKVIVINSGWNGRAEYIGEIIKKTPTGLVDVRYNGTIVVRFRQYGYPYEKRDAWSRSSTTLEYYTAERADAIRKRIMRSNIIKFLKDREWGNYGDAELEQIYNFIKGLRST